MPAYKIQNRFLLLFISTFATLISITMSGTSVEQISRANNQFGMKLFRAVAKDEENKLVCPFSAHVVLSMAYQGTAGKTLENFADVFDFPSVEDTAEQYSQILTKLSKIESVTLNIANKIYIANKFHLNPNFKQIIETKYSSEAEEIDFKNGQLAAQNINQWVENKTNNKIKELIKPDMIDESTRLVLLNAVYFKGNWLHKFDASLTQKKPFYLSNGDEIQVDMMSTKNKFRYHENNDFKAIELPYQGNDLSMIIYLPNDRNGINQLQEKIATTDISELTQDMRQFEVNLELPKFRIESTIPMKDALVELGAGNMFSDQADFSNMADAPLKVSDVIQKTFIEVNEEGAEAAAATGSVSFRRSLMIENPILIHFKVDHPFMFSLLYKRFTIFVGKYVPEKIQILG